MSSQSPLSSKIYSDVKIFNDKIISVWNDTRNDPFDIYCNIRSFANPDTTVNIKLISHAIPENFKLYQNYPNPFNPVTKIGYLIPKPGFVSLKVYDVLGKEVATLVNQVMEPGKYSLEFKGESLASGLYFYTIKAGNFTETIRLRRRMLLIK